ncbi:MAG: glycosyltransferase family 4 protein [Gemmatimonadales bacterium]
MRILAVNWLDLENPQFGGAEVHFFEIFGRLVRRGHHVTLISSGWPGAAARANVSGIEVRRFADRYGFALKARAAVRRAQRDETFDIVVEDINKLPLYLPYLTRLPVYAIVPHLFGTTAFREASLPVAAMVWLAEKWIPRVYRNAAFHVISKSTRDDLIARGVRPSAIQVIFPGVDVAWFSSGPEVSRADTPTFLYVGRLKKYKGIESMIRAMALVKQAGHDASLDIAGRGDDLGRLRKLVQRLELGGTVRFLGFVGEADKRLMLKRAWAVIFPSAKEGWGITNVEAAACGTPAIASDSPGLRETVIDGRTGSLVRHGDHVALAREMSRLAGDRSLVEKLGAAGRTFAEKFSWDRAADETEDHMLATIANNTTNGAK